MAAHRQWWSPVGAPARHLTVATIVLSGRQKGIYGVQMHTLPDEPMPNSPTTSNPPADRGQARSIDLGSKCAQLNRHWQPHVVAEMNSYQVKVVKVLGDFVWHRHADTDETFLVLAGELHIEIRGGPSGDDAIVVRAGQMAVVPRGVEHRPRAFSELQMLLIEPRGVVNTGDGPRVARSADDDRWI